MILEITSTTELKEDEFVGCEMIEKVVNTTSHSKTVKFISYTYKIKLEGTIGNSLSGWHFLISEW